LSKESWLARFAAWLRNQWPNMKRKTYSNREQVPEEDHEQFSKEEIDKVKKQFSDSEWRILMSSPEFRDRWVRREIIKAQELASVILKGNFENPKAATLFNKLRA
jgi:Na+-transporting NADH:ubiquinone oxidoreductase subunit NqrF